MLERERNECSTHLSPTVAVVGLERTYYNVSESVGVVEVCAVVYQPTGVCPIQFPFDVTLSTRDGSAGSVNIIVRYNIL